MKMFKKIFWVAMCLMFLSSCGLSSYLSSALSNLNVSSTTSSAQISGSSEGCKIYETLDILIEQEDVKLLSASTSLQDVYDEVTKSTFMATACYIVNGTQYEKLSSGFIISKTQLEDEYEYFLVSSASSLFYRSTNGLSTTVNREPEYVEVVFGNYRRYYAEIVSYFERFDMVILSIKTKDELEPLTLGDSDSIEIGDTVSAIGTPSLGINLLNTFIKGNISALDKTSQISYNDEQIASFPSHQFDAPTNDGMQGGPVLNEAGEVIGVLTYKYGGNSGYESLSRFIPINILKNCIDSLINEKTYSLPLLGVSVYELYVAVSQLDIVWPNNVGVYEGLYVDEVSAGSVSANAGIKSNSVITQIVQDGKTYKITGSATLSSFLATCDRSKEFVVTVVYEKEVKEYTISFNA